MLIFDSFKNIDDAEKFARENKGKVFLSQNESNAIDPFPFKLIPPIVLVERPENFEDEVEIQKSSKKFGGIFAGT